MKIIKLLLLSTILLVLTVNAFFVQMQAKIYQDNYQLNISNLDERQDIEEVTEEIINYLKKNQINIYTTGGEYIDGVYETYLYSNYINQDELTSLIPLKTGDYPGDDEYLSNDANDSNKSGLLKGYYGKNQQVKGYSLEKLKNRSLDRQYYFVNISSEQISQLSAILNNYDLEYSFSSSPSPSNQIINKQVIILILYLLLMLLLLSIISWTSQARNYAIKHLNGYSYIDLLVEEAIVWMKSILPLILVELCLVLVIIIKTGSLFFSLQLLGILIPQIVVLLVIYSVLTMFAMILTSLWIDLRSISNNVDYQILLFLTKILKYSLFVAMFLISANAVNIHSEIKGVKAEIEKWQKLEGYYTTGYRHLTEDINDHLDFETMELDQMEAQSKEFIEKTEQKLSGVFIDSNNFSDLYANTCSTNTYTINCNSAIINENYVNFEKIEDINGKAIEFENQKIDVIMPKKMEKQSKDVLKQIANSINEVSPIFTYTSEDFNVHYIDDDYCYETYNLELADSCVDGIAIELGDYYYNYSLALANGSYFIHLIDDVDNQLKEVVNDDSLLYHFNIIDPKTGEIIEKQQELKRKELMNMSKVIIIIVMLFATSFYTNLLYIKANIQTLSIKTLHGYSSQMLIKKFIAIDIIIDLIILIFIVPRTIILFALNVILLDIIICLLMFRRISSRKIMLYVKGKND